MSCLVCGEPALTPGLDLKRQAVSSFYLPRADAPERPVPLAIGQCRTCATVQLTQPLTPAELTPPYDWIFAREPEGHLDRMVDGILQLPGVDETSTVVGLTAKDDTTLARFVARGLARTWRIEPGEDLGAASPNAGVETIQALTTPEALAPVAARRGPADVLIVRHIIEHAQDLSAFLDGCKALTKDGGYVVFEAPDCTRSLDLADFTMVWEEHSLYFTPRTLRAAVERAGFSICALDIYPYPFENSLVLIARKAASPTASVRAEAEELDRFGAYVAAFEPAGEMLRERLTAYRQSGPVAIFGAGHLACAFVNFHGLTDLVDFVVDDTPEKQGLFLPGARLPIVPSAALTERQPSVCLLAVSPQSEEGIMARNLDYQAAGGVFKSVLCASERSIRNAS